MTIGIIVTASASDAAKPLLHAERQDDERVDEQARDDLGQCRHGLDDRAHRPRQRAAHLDEEQRGQDAERNGDRLAIAICSREPTSACTMPPEVSGSSGPVSAIVWVKKLLCRDRRETAEGRVRDLIDHGGEYEQADAREQHRDHSSTTTLRGHCAPTMPAYSARNTR